MDAGYDACTFVAAPLNVPGDYETIQAAIAAAQPGNTVLVASGTYDETIIMKPGVSLQGAGADETTIAGAGIYVILCEVSDCKIDGFTIKGSQYGIWNVGSSPTITNNIITGNTSCAIYNYLDCSPTITNNIITGNPAGIWNVESSPTITNNTITGNNDSGIYNKDSSLSTITNNIITGNRKGIENNGASPNISYNDVWGNTTNYYGCSAGPHDTSANPLFVEAGYWDNGGTPEDPSDDFWVEGDYHLQAGSDCIDAGWNDAPDLPGTDFDGNPRIVDGDGDEMAVVDMGAFEYQVAESNHPPVADAGSDQTLEQQTYEGTKVTLNGSGSADPDSTQGTNDDIVSFEWYDGDTLLGTGQAIEHTFPLGSHTVTLVVTDNFGETDEDEIVIIVQDTTVPDIEITYPSDGAKVFMDEEIGVEYSVSDNCDPNPTVTVSPEDLSPPLPIGELTITVTATDAYGNEASDSVTVNVLGPAGIKGDAVSELERVNTGCWRVDRVIDKVITFINKSLEEEYWVDDLHLDAKRGGKVFTYGNLAVGDMKLHLKLWEKRGPTPAQQEAIDAFEAVIPKLLKADKLLAETAIDEAKNTTDPWNPGKSRAYNRFLTKGDKDFEKALSYMDKDRPGLAIVAFKRAWKFAQQAMRLAQ